jgi:hypothetical protein
MGNKGGRHETHYATGTMALKPGNKKSLALFWQTLAKNTQQDSAHPS